MGGLRRAIGCPLFQQEWDENYSSTKPPHYGSTLKASPDIDPTHIVLPYWNLILRPLDVLGGIAVVGVAEGQAPVGLSGLFWCLCKPGLCFFSHSLNAEPGWSYVRSLTCTSQKCSLCVTLMCNGVNIASWSALKVKGSGDLRRRSLSNRSGDIRK